jgi:Zn-dependent protease
MVIIFFAEQKNMGLISLLFSNPITFLILVIPLLYSVIIHEVAHGWVAELFGDHTARYAGRLSLNPKSHIDPLGALALLFVGFGWARPVPVNFYNLKNFRLGLICVALAGCVANILLATTAIALLRINALASYDLTASILFVIARINITLGAFNLIPIPPLDGSKILMGILPANAQRVLISLEPFGLFILLFLLYTKILNPVIDITQNFIFLLIGLVLGK